MNKSFWLTMSVTSVLSVAQAQAPNPSSNIVASCPQMRQLPPEFGVKWVIGTKTDRLFINSQFYQEQNLTIDTFRRLKELNDLLKQKGTILILVPIPLIGLYYGDIIDRSDPLVKDIDFDKAKNSYNSLIHDLNSQGIHTVNLGGLPDKLKGQPEEFTFPRDIHWTTTGLSESALLLSNYIKTNFPKEYQSIKKSEIKLTKGAPSQIEGFVYQKVLCDIPLQATSYTPYSHISIDPTNDLLGDQEQPIVLLGDSFVKGRPEWGFNSVLSSYLQVDVTNYGVPAGGMVVSPALYFNSLDSSTTMPKFLIWQISVRADGADGNILRQSINALQQCKSVWESGIDPNDGKEVSFSIPEVDNPGFFKLTDYLVGDNLTLKVNYKSGEQQSYTYNRFSSFYRLDNLDTYYLPIPLEREDDSISSITASHSPKSLAKIELCQR